MINIESLKETLPTFNQVKDNGPYLVFHTEQSIQLAIAEQLQESSKQLKRIADCMTGNQVHVSHVKQPFELPQSLREASLTKKDHND